MDFLSRNLKRIFKRSENPWIEKESWLIRRKNRYTVTFGDFKVESTLYDIPVTSDEKPYQHAAFV